ncbi:DUF192 domain-containing protein [Ovoidimarina sediminis]|uniref:DUF192 domain-containing protein n=1 Tax=Ovoidimarina sediminis TaxID=3079856 RepID=UPI00291302BE|nr:DUF192 domain-containing protein [Rhodophyticola sp. MJ-SS7]MDU8942165.1 DUF192 domain-containing protein [Rhodophyticola sp. MJ-SS7]
MGSGAKRRFLTVLAAANLAAGIANAACVPDVVEVRGDWGKARFTVDIADDPQERARGLMHVPEMAQSRGMLFLYDAPHHATFWMKNTLIPLDMIFIGEDGVVTHVHENAIPHDETVIDGGEGVVAVLEINGGLSSRFGIEPGDALRHPGIDQNLAAWPCE